MKKILILCFLGDPTYPAGSVSGTGGFNASVRDILNYLVDSPQFECILVTNCKKNSSKALLEKISDKITLYRVCPNKEQSVNDYDISTILGSVEQIVEDFTNISFIHSFYWLSGMVASILSDKYNVPFVHTTVSLAKEKLRNGFKPSVTHQLKYENIFLPKAKYILAITDEEKRLLISEYNISSKKIIIEGQTVAEEYHTPLHDNYGMPSTIEPHTPKILPIDFKEINITNDIWWNSKAFVFVGRITKIKGLDIIIRAWLTLSMLFDGHIPPLWIVGNTPCEIECFRNELNIDLELLKKYEMEHKIVWWGYLSSAAISTLYLKASVLVTHSAFEGGGRMILEALCQGIPVITTNTGFGKDYIENWLNGFIVNYGDIDCLILRMSHFVRNPFLSNTLGSNARKTFKTLEEMWHHKIRIVKLYEALSLGNNYVDDLNEFLPISEDSFDKGIIETYPYYYLRKSASDVAKIIQTIDKHNDILLITSKITQIGNADIWQYSDKFVIKFIYSKLNKRKIWDVSEIDSVLNVQRNMEKLNTLCTLPTVLKPLKIDQKDCYILMPYSEILSKHEIVKNYILVAKTLSSISINKEFDVTHSLVTYWSNTKQNIIMSNIDFINKLNTSIPNKIRKHMEQISEPETSDSFCIQYSQSLLGHIGLYNGKLYILPSYNWLIAEKGLDAGLFFCELLYFGKKEFQSNKLELLSKLSTTFNIPKLKIIEWAFCICINKLIQDVIFENQNTGHYTIYDEILKIFLCLI